MTAARKALVIGGGIGGMSSAIAMRQHGIEVDIIDCDPDWRVIGAGITITGPTLRAFRALGLLEGVSRDGFLSKEVRFYTAAGDLVSVMPTPVLEEGIPPAGGILRPALHHIMSERTRELGADVRLGITADEITDDGTKVTVRFSNGDVRDYDVAIGADGFQSATRRLLFPDAPVPKFIGQGCWRCLAPRPPEVMGAEIYFGPGYKVGLNPCAPDAMYIFVTMSMPGNPFIPEEEQLDRMRDILAPIGGRIALVREGLGPQSNVNYRPLEALLLPPPWHKGRVGLVGDTVHATTPHLASGAGMAVEDGVLLAEHLVANADVEAALASFEERRWERCRTVVENSLLISRLEIEGGHDSDVSRLMAESLATLAAPM